MHCTLAIQGPALCIAVDSLPFLLVQCCRAPCCSALLCEIRMRKTGVSPRFRVLLPNTALSTSETDRRVRDDGLPGNGAEFPHLLPPGVLAPDSPRDLPGRRDWQYRSVLEPAADPRY